MPAWWLRATLVMAVAHTATSAGIGVWTFCVYGHFKTANIILSSLVLSMATMTPCATWFFFEWIASRFNRRRTPSATTFVYGSLVFIGGTCMIGRSALELAFNGGMEFEFPGTIVMVSIMQCFLL